MTPDEIASLPYRPCAGIVLVNQDGLVFAGRRNDTPEAWQMPQGGIDAGEAPEEAAIRELWEETGVPAELVQIETQTPDWIAYDLPQHLIGKVWKGRYRGQKQLWFLIRFLGEDHQIQIDTDHPEFSEWQWMAAADLIEKIVPFKRATYERVFTAFEGKLAPPQTS